jgi:hypothetical protein
LFTNIICVLNLKFLLKIHNQKETKSRSMSQKTQSSRIMSSSLKNIHDEIDLDNVINKLNNTLGNYLDIFNLYNANITIQNEKNHSAKSNLSSQSSYSDKLAWSSTNSSNLFVRVNDLGEWIEKVDGEDKYRFKFVRYDQNNGGLLLFDNDRNVFVEIDGQQARVGSDLKNLNKMYLGDWIGLGSSQDLTNLFNSGGKIFSF